MKNHTTEKERQQWRSYFNAALSGLCANPGILNGMEIDSNEAECITELVSHAAGIADEAMSTAIDEAEFFDK